MKLIVRTAMALGAAGLFLSGLFAATASADITGNENYATQLGVNASSSVQASAAVSGTATAADDATATSGDATAESIFAGAQSIVAAQYNQTDAGAGLDISDNFNGTVDVPVSQGAANTLENSQSNAAVSGNADAIDMGSSTTGAAYSTLANVQAQTQELLQSNQSLFPPPPAPAQ